MYQYLSIYQITSPSNLHFVYRSTMIYIILHRSTLIYTDPCRSIYVNIYIYTYTHIAYIYMYRYIYIYIATTLFILTYGSTMFTSWLPRRSTPSATRARRPDVEPDAASREAVAGGAASSGLLGWEKAVAEVDISIMYIYIYIYINVNIYIYV